jgi:phosphatidylglycerol:prolipoprotein diacylglycerol transferase
MHQILINIPVPGFLQSLLGRELPIYSYGLMMVLGFLAAIQLAKYLAGRNGLDPEIFVNAGLLALVTGVAGARLSHVLENIHQYTDPSRSIWANFKDAINIRSGGLTYYGGFLLAFPSLVLYAISRKVPLRLGMDITAPCIVIGLAFGRIGCFLNGCCYGDHCDVPWLGVSYPYESIAYDVEYQENTLPKPPPRELLVDQAIGEPRLLSRAELKTPTLLQLAAAQRSQRLHPAQLYSSFTAFLIAAITLCYFTLPHAPGRGFALMLMLEGSTRFVLELLRVEPPVIGNFSLSMILGIGLAVLGVALWIAFGLLSRNPLAAPAQPAIL